MAAKHSMDLTQGSVLKKLLLFALPVLATNLLQQLYSAADVIVVGKFAGSTALAAVGSTGAVTTLLLNVFLGLAIGANVVCANLYGARQKEALSRCMHTSVLLALIGGLALAVLGIAFARPLLKLMNSPDNVIDQAAKYMRIYFCGAPASLLYNFGAGILRAHGDTKRPMVILSLSGIVNVALNLVLVVCLHWDVAGVAVATVVSQVLSAAGILWILFDPKDEFKLQLRKIRFYAKPLRMIVGTGIPCGLNGVVFSLSNVILQSTVNTFGDVIIAGAAAASNITNFVFQFLSAFYTASVSFAGQNFGAKQYKRIDQLLVKGIISCATLVFLSAVLLSIFPKPVLQLYADDPNVVSAAIPLTLILCWAYILYVIPEVTVGCLRGIGKSSVSTFLNIFCICAPRIVWIYVIFPLNPTMQMLYLCYPMSYVICAAAQLGYYLRCRKRLLKPAVTTSA